LSTALNTLAFTFGSAALAVVLGAAMAWAVSTVNLPGVTVLRMLPVCALLLPPLVKDPSWVVLFSSKTGLVNLGLRHLFGSASPTFNVYSLPGMISVLGFFAAPIAYLIMLTPFEGLDRSVVEASRMSGARLGRTVFRVMMPIVRPALLSASVLLLIITFSSFETPVIIGLPGRVNTFMGRLYELTSEPIPNLNVAAAQGSIYLVATGLLVYFYIRATRNERRFAAISGRGHDPARFDGRIVKCLGLVVVLGYCLLAVVGPIGLTIIISLLPFYSAVNGNPFHSFTLTNYKSVLEGADIRGSMIASGVIAICVVVGVIVAGGLLSWMSLKSTSRFRRLCEAIAMAPIAVPALVYSFGLLLAVLAVPAFARVAYGSRGVMFVADLIVFIPVTVRLFSSALIQIDDELIEASRTSGAGLGRSVVRIVAPIMRPAVLYIGAVVFVLSYRELGAIVLLPAANTPLVSFVTFSAWANGGYPELAALNVITIVVPLLFVSLMFGVDGVVRRLMRVRRQSAAVVALRGVVPVGGKV
jgi:iron(III) transport system permease protein